MDKFIKIACGLSVLIGAAMADTCTREGMGLMLAAMLIYAVRSLILYTMESLHLEIRRDRK